MTGSSSSSESAPDDPTEYLLTAEDSTEDLPTTDDPSEGRSLDCMLVAPTLDCRLLALLLDCGLSFEATAPATAPEGASHSDAPSVPGSSGLEQLMSPCPSPDVLVRHPVSRVSCGWVSNKGEGVVVGEEVVDRRCRPPATLLPGRPRQQGPPWETPSDASDATAGEDGGRRTGR
jgi:hypothetical protein